MFYAIFNLAFSDKMDRLLALATVNLSRRQMHRPKAHRRKGQEFVPAYDRLVMLSHDYEGIHL
jgi:hypothetical protein